MKKAYFKGAHLEGADLRGADLKGAKFWSADLKGADLRGADLKKADFSGADLEGTDLRGTDLEKATGLKQDQLKRAFGDTETKLPKNDKKLIPPDHWLQPRKKPGSGIWPFRGLLAPAADFKIAGVRRRGSPRRSSDSGPAA